MNKAAFLLAPLLTLAVVQAQDHDMATMTGGAMMDTMTGGMMTGGAMTGGAMTGGAMMMQSAEVALSGDQEVPPVATDATGSATVTLSGSTLSLQGEVSGLSSALVEVAGSPGHVHMAPMGENGDVVFPLNVTEAEDGTSALFSLETELSDDQLAALMAGELYLNFHTEANPSGELRGQIVLGM